MNEPVNSPITKDTRLCISLAQRPSNFGTRFQNFLYRELGLDFVYKASTTTDIEGAVRGIRALEIRGCAISMPFKEAVIPLIDEIDPSASRIGAVNTIVNTDGRLKGYNTDYIAVLDLLKRAELSSSSKIALHGSGGMAKAVACALNELRLREVQVIARNRATGARLAETYGFQYSSTFSDRYEVLINITPIGMAPNPEKLMPFDGPLVEKSKLVFDVIAYPPETALIEYARRARKNVITGFEVVTLQGLEQFKLYTGVTPPSDLVKKAAEFARLI